MEEIKGYISTIRYHLAETGFTVLEVTKDEECIVCVGVQHGFSEGESVLLQGEYVVHPIHNRQFKFTRIQAVEPEDVYAIERYLGSGAIKGVGEALAKRIVKAFGEDTFRIAQEEPQRLAEVKGISHNKAIEIATQLEEKKELRDVMLFLQNYGISVNLANKIYHKYGVGIYEVMRENPYRLAEDIDGVGFRIADEIAVKCGIAVDSDYRIRCGLLHTLLQTTYEGHCYYPKEQLLEKTSELLGTSLGAMENQLLNLAMDKKITLKTIAGENRVYAERYYQIEQQCAYQLLQLKNEYDHPICEMDDEEIDRKLALVELEAGLRLEPLQKQALRESVKNGVFLLTGGPGTGKTTTINAIIRFFYEEGMNILLAAPTGRAAKRMTETTGFEARTIHRMLEVGGEMGSSESGAERTYFTRNEENPLEADVVIIDEMSMVDIHLLRALLRALVPGTKLIMVGDVDQLHSVGPGQVLRDLLGSAQFAYVELEKIFRQAEESHIVSYAHKINKGIELDFTEKYPDFFLLEKDDPEIIYYYMEALIRDKIPKQFQIQASEVQVLSPMKKGPLGVEQLNLELQKRLNPPAPKKVEHAYGDKVFREGDKVMQIKNNYELEWEIRGKYNIPIETGKGIFNGDVGKICSILEHTRTISVEFDDGRCVEYSFDQLEELELAYAITIHKAQGSEYPAIIMPLLSGPQVLFTRNLLYTGVTRAKNCVVILGSGAKVNEMIRCNAVQHRYTSLKERLGG